MAWKHGKPVIGLAGGIGSGKSFVAKALADLGCGIISSDKDAHEALNHPDIRDQMVVWWGASVLKPDGTADRRAIARIVFNAPEQARRLNGLIHPRVAQMREKRMAELAADSSVRAIVLDTPLLFEVGMGRLCDAIFFVQTPYDLRLARVKATRGWSEEELRKREKLQLPLDKKEKLADYVIDNSGEEPESLRQVQRAFSQLLSRDPSPPDRP